MRCFNCNCFTWVNCKLFAHALQLIPRKAMMRRLIHRWSLQPFDNYWRLVITIPMSQHVGPYNRSTIIGDSWLHPQCPSTLQDVGPYNRSTIIGDSWLQSRCPSTCYKTLVLTTVRQLLATRDWTYKCYKTLVLTTVRQLLATRDYNPNVPARWRGQCIVDTHVAWYWFSHAYNRFKTWPCTTVRPHVATMGAALPMHSARCGDCFPKRLVITIPMSQHDGVANASWTFMWPGSGLAMRFKSNLSQKVSR